MQLNHTIRDYSSTLHHGIRNACKTAIMTAFLVMATNSGLEAQTQPHYFSGESKEMMMHVNRSFDSFKKSQQQEGPYVFINSQQYGWIWKNKHKGVRYDQEGQSLVQQGDRLAPVTELPLSTDARLRGVVRYQIDGTEDLYLIRQPQKFMPPSLQQLAPQLFLHTTIKPKDGLYHIGYTQEPGMWIPEQKIRQDIYTDSTGDVLNASGNPLQRHIHPLEDDIGLALIKQWRLELGGLFHGDVRSTYIGHEISHKLLDVVMLTSHADVTMNYGTVKNLSFHHAVGAHVFPLQSRHWKLGAHAQAEQGGPGYHEGHDHRDFSYAGGLSLNYIFNPLQVYARALMDVDDQSLALAYGLQLHPHNSNLALVMQGSIGGNHPGTQLGIDWHPRDQRFSRLRVGPYTGYSPQNGFYFGAIAHYLLGKQQ